MSMLDLLVIAAFLAIVILGHIAITPFSLLVLVAVLVVVRFLKGDRL